MAEVPTVIATHLTDWESDAETVAFTRETKQHLGSTTLGDGSSGSSKYCCCSSSSSSSSITSKLATEEVLAAAATTAPKGSTAADVLGCQMLHAVS
jgi:hypothetical protein